MTRTIVLPLPLAHVAPREREAVFAVWQYADAHLSSLHRRTGESYAMHGLEVAESLADISSDTSLLRVAILHDLLVHPDGRTLLRLSPLTEREQSLVRAMHRLRRLRIDANTADLDMAIAAFAKDENILFLRLAHRRNDVRHLARFSPLLRKRIARETIDRYAVIAGHVGFYPVRTEMEDRCFHALSPVSARNLERRFTSARSLDLACLSHAETFIRAALKKQSIHCDIEQRIKSLYSAYRKMLIKGRRFDELTDRLALRVIVQTIPECYVSLGVVHTALHPIPGKLKDYIGSPKENGYRSLHTVIHPLPGVIDQPIEIQIRTRGMQEEAEKGRMSHAHYKLVLTSMRAPISRTALRKLIASKEKKEGQ